MDKKNNRVLRLSLGGMLAALIFVATSFFKLPVSITQGYIHLGDGFILLGAALLGNTAIIAAALGKTQHHPQGIASFGRYDHKPYSP